MTPRGFEDGRQQRSQRKLKYKRCKCGKFGLGVPEMRASKRGLAQTGCIDMVSVDLNALEIGAVLLLEGNHEIQRATESCAAVTVFAHLPMKSCKPAKSCTSCLGLSARKVKGQLRDVSFWYVNPRMVETCEVLVAVSETSDMSHDVSLTCCYKDTQACVYHEGCGTKLELESNSRPRLLCTMLGRLGRTAIQV